LPQPSARRYTNRSVLAPTDVGPSYKIQNVKINGTFESVENIKYLGIVATNQNFIHEEINKTKTNSMALVRKRTIPTEQPPLVGEVSDNFCGWRVSRGQRNGSPRPLISFFIILIMLPFSSESFVFSCAV
jgi:hypothetical protein